jgi:hypothetical protein
LFCVESNFLVLLSRKIKSTDFPVMNALAEAIPADPDGNNPAISCPSCGGLLLPAALEACAMLLAGMLPAFQPGPWNLSQNCLKQPGIVIPAITGIQKPGKIPYSGLRRDDDKTGH